MKDKQLGKLREMAAIAKLVRWPNLAIIFLTQYVVFFFVVKNKLTGFYSWLPPSQFFLLSIGTILVAAGGYVINDYYDIKIDLVNKPRRIVIGRIISRRQALFFHSILNILAIALGFMLSWHVALFFAGCEFLLWLYSNILKRTPLFGNLVISVLTAAVIWAISLYFRENNKLIYIYSAFAFGVSLLREIIKDMEDTKGDAAYGCKTLPIVWGIRKTKALLIFLLMSSIILLIRQALKETAIYYFIILPLLYVAYRIILADKQKDYSDLSAFCKWLMLGGVMSLGFI